MISCPHRALMIGCGLLALADRGAAYANTPPNGPQTVMDAGNLQPRTENGRQIYEAAQFQRFAPQTALDMVRQIPGFSISEVSSDRGLGEASQNVLINGQRVTGKSNDAETALSRIPVASVIRLEVADAATFNISGLNGQVVNVLVREAGLKGNFTLRPELRERSGFDPRSGELNLSGRLGKGTFTLGINNNDAFDGSGWGDELNVTPAGQLLYTRAYNSLIRGDRPRIAGSYNLQADNGNILNANGAVEYFRFRRRTEFTRLAPGQAEILEVSRGRENEYNYELGGDYEFRIGDGRLKLIAYHRFENSDLAREFRSDLGNGNPARGQRFEQLIDEGETVLRSEYRWKAGKNDWQFSLEGALNYLDATAEFFTLAGNIYQPVPIPGASSRVEEKRAQGILSHGRPLSDSISLQTSLGAEYSKLSQTGPNGLTRSFVRPKGSVALNWKATPTFTVSSKLQRKVGQLRFFDFLASVDVQNGNNNSDNPELVPPQSWLWENEANLSLGKAGSIKLKLDGELISDLVDQIPVSPTEEAVGNLSGTAKRLRGEFNGSFILDSIGFKGAKLDLVLALQTSSVRDPLLQTNRPLSRQSRASWSLDLRHDIPDTQWAWGLFAEDSRDNGFYRLDFFEREFRTGPFTLAFVEHKNVLGLKVRATMLNLIGQRERSRELFYLNRRNGPIDFIRTSDFRYGTFYRLTISGTF